MEAEGLHLTAARQLRGLNEVFMEIDDRSPPCLSWIPECSGNGRLGTAATSQELLGRRGESTWPWCRRRGLLGEWQKIDEVPFIPLTRGIDQPLSLDCEWSG